MKKYIIILFAMMAIVGAKAQTKNHIIYQEFEQDFWITLTVNQSYDIDINLDGLSDLRYTTFEGASGAYTLASSFAAVSPCQVCYYSTLTWGYPYENFFLDIGIPLNDTSLCWGGLCHAESINPYPNTFPLSYKIGIRYRDGEDYYYGWGEFEETRNGGSEALFHISKICYCAIPNYPLVWGQTSLTEGVEEKDESNFACLYPNPTNGQVTITGQDLKSAEVFNTLGQRVASATGEGEGIMVDLSGLPASVYFVNITDKEGRKCVRKVVKQ